ncbi:MAG: hypothetical protein M3362_00300 [Acidobacteriota bacterium]|nr:hypothetical protein [Acidobacteriota bacterium]
MANIVIKDFQSGIADSPHLGFADIRNVDIYSSPGVVRLNWKTTKQSGTNVTDLIKWFVTNPSNGDIYGLGDTGKVYKSTTAGASWSVVSGNTTTSAAGNGLAIWKDYLIVARNVSIDVYGPLSGTPTWSNPFGTLQTSAFHPMLATQDDKLHIGNGRYMASVQERASTTFDPGNSSTFLFNDKALDLPANYQVKCLAELGTNLMIGTWQGSTIYQRKVADIFPWDKKTSSFTQPLKIGENGINQMMTFGNLLYIIAGTNHNMYVSNGASVSPFKKLPSSVTSLDYASGTYMDPYPGAITSHKGRIFTGVSSGTQSSMIDGFGVWSVEPSDRRLVFENQISTGTTNATNNIRIGALASVSNDSYLISWQDNTTYGIDVVGNSFYDSYAGYVVSPLIQVGSPMPNARIQITKQAFQLAKPLATGQGIRLKYRRNLSDNWTTIGTYDYATNGAVISGRFEVPINDAEFIQIRAELTTSNTSPELKYVILQ